MCLFTGPGSVPGRICKSLIIRPFLCYYSGARLSFAAPQTKRATARLKFVRPAPISILNKVEFNIKCKICCTAATVFLR